MVVETPDSYHSTLIKTILRTTIEIRLLLTFTNILLYFVLLPKSINLIKSLLHVTNTALVILLLD